MPIPEALRLWTFTGSTGTGKAVDLRNYARQITVGFETSSGCTGTVQLLHRMGSSAGPYHLMHSTALSTGLFAHAQFLGPLEWVKPRLTDLTTGSTNIVRVYLSAN
jgi:hypothetical protein